MTSSSVTIRSYAPIDRDAVREIACDTADSGRPIERFFSDRVLAADLLTHYYTDIDSRALWIAESGGRVAGYLSGAFDTAAYRKVMARRVILPAILKAVGRGLLSRGDTWRLIRAGLGTLRLGGHRRRIPLDLYPAHLHINLRETERSHGFGRALMERYIQQLRERGIPGVHAVVNGHNLTSCRFFEKMGFHAIGRQPVFFSDGEGVKRGETVVYARKT